MEKISLENAMYDLFRYFRLKDPGSDFADAVYEDVKFIPNDALVWMRLAQLVGGGETDNATSDDCNVGLSGRHGRIRLSGPGVRYLLKTPAIDTAETAVSMRQVVGQGACGRAVSVKERY